MTDHDDRPADDITTAAAATSQEDLDGDEVAVDDFFDDPDLGISFPDDLSEERNAAEILRFWEDTRHLAGVVRTSVVTGPGVTGTMVPQSWYFGDNPELADELLVLVLTGIKTGTASALVEFERAEEPVPLRGDLSIVLDGQGHPRALIRTTEVAVVPFDQVDEEHAAAEGEDDRSLASWRVEHEKYWRRVLADLDVEFSMDLPVVTERFEVLYPRLETSTPDEQASTM